MYTVWANNQRVAEAITKTGATQRAVDYLLQNALLNFGKQTADIVDPSGAHVSTVALDLRAFAVHTPAI